MSFIESNIRTLSKTLIYRILIIVTDGIVVYIFTKRIDVTLGSIGVLTVANTLLYYFYERFWNKVRWGRRKSSKRKG